jgi:hypothetical protein
MASGISQSGCMLAAFLQTLINLNVKAKTWRGYGSDEARCFFGVDVAMDRHCAVPG